MARQFDFPTLLDKDLIANLCDLGIRKEEATSALTKASPDSVRRVFEVLLEKVCQISRNNLAPDFRCTGHLASPEIHDEGIYLLELLRVLKEWHSKCGVSDFSLRDLCDPQPKRLRRHLSALLNFTRFCEWKAELEDELEDEAERAFEKNADLQRSLQQQEAEYAALLEEQARKEQAVGELRTQKQELKAQLKENGARFEQSSRRLDAVNLELDALEQEIKAVRFMHQTDAEDSIRQLRSRIVESPEKLLQEIKDVRDALAQVDVNNADIDQSTFEFQQRSQCVAKLHKEVAEMLSYIVNKVAPTLREKQLVSQACKAKQQELEQAQLQQEALLATSNHLKQTLQAAKEALARDLKQTAARKDASFSKLEMARREKEKNEAKMEVLQATMRENQSKARKQRAKREEFETAIAAKSEHLLSKFAAASQALSRYHSRFDSLSCAEAGVSAPYGAHSAGDAMADQLAATLRGIAI